MEGIFGIKLQETRVYQQAWQEGIEEGKREAVQEFKLKLVPKLLARGMSIEDISQLLGLTIETGTPSCTQSKILNIKSKN